MDRFGPYLGVSYNKIGVTGGIAAMVRSLPSELGPTLKLTRPSAEVTKISVYLLSPQQRHKNCPGPLEKSGVFTLQTAVANQPLVLITTKAGGWQATSAYQRCCSPNFEAGTSNGNLR